VLRVWGGFGPSGCEKWVETWSFVSFVLPVFLCVFYLDSGLEYPLFDVVDGHA
jgi:hypothetical protein